MECCGIASFLIGWIVISNLSPRRRPDFGRATSVVVGTLLWAAAAWQQPTCAQQTTDEDGAAQLSGHVARITRASSSAERAAAIAEILTASTSATNHRTLTMVI